MRPPENADDTGENGPRKGTEAKRRGAWSATARGLERNGEGPGARVFFTGPACRDGQAEDDFSHVTKLW